MRKFEFTITLTCNDKYYENELSKIEKEVNSGKYVEDIMSSDKARGLKAVEAHFEEIEE